MRNTYVFHVGEQEHHEENVLGRHKVQVAREQLLPDLRTLAHLDRDQALLGDYENALARHKHLLAVHAAHLGRVLLQLEFTGLGAARVEPLNELLAHGVTAAIAVHDRIAQTVAVRGSVTIAGVVIFCDAVAVAVDVVLVVLWMGRRCSAIGGGLLLLLLELLELLAVAARVHGHYRRCYCVNRWHHRWCCGRWRRGRWSAVGVAAGHTATCKRHGTLLLGLAHLRFSLAVVRGRKNTKPNCMTRRLHEGCLKEQNTLCIVHRIVHCSDNFLHCAMIIPNFVCYTTCKCIVHCILKSCIVWSSDMDFRILRKMTKRKISMYFCNSFNNVSLAIMT